MTRHVLGAVLVSFLYRRLPAQIPEEPEHFYFGNECYYHPYASLERPPPSPLQELHVRNVLRSLKALCPSQMI
jgi:hypothetical protein